MPITGRVRYCELQQRLPAIAPNIPTARLRRLEAQGLVLCTRYSARPPRFDYRLTLDGAALADPIRLLSAWAGSRAPTAPPGARHLWDAAGGALVVAHV